MLPRFLQAALAVAAAPGNELDTADDTAAGGVRPAPAPRKPARWTWPWAARP
jgi:hypothetical protein